MGHWHVPHPGAGELAGGVDALTDAAREGLESTLVHRLRDEPADVRVHPPGLVDEQAPLRRDRRVLLEQVFEHRHACAGRMNRLGNLRELLRITEQNHVARARAHRERVRQRDLTGLVDEQVVERAVHLLAAEQPRGPCQQVVVAAGEVGQLL
jgi:hypothetical protein